MLDRDYFEALYARADDPWSFATSDYEREKYDRTVATLGDARFATGLEIGCSIGVLTRDLAVRVDALYAIDVSEAALDRARRRCADLPNVAFARASFPAECPVARADLVVVSEVAYYWSADDFARARDRIAATLAPDGRLLLVHFLPKVDEYVRDGDAVHDTFLADGRFASVAAERAERYRIDLVRLRSTS